MQPWHTRLYYVLWECCAVVILDYEGQGHLDIAVVPLSIVDIHSIVAVVREHADKGTVDDKLSGLLSTDSASS